MDEISPGCPLGDGDERFAKKNGNVYTVPRENRPLVNISFNFCLVLRDHCSLSFQFTDNMGI